MRDRYGITQIVFDDKQYSDSFKIAKKLGFEDVIGITGNVISRPDEEVNKNMATEKLMLLLKKLLFIMNLNHLLLILMIEVLLQKKID